MDIDILLALQDFRNNIGAPLVDFFSKMTFLGELNSAIVIMAVVYWCCSKSFGSYLLMGWSGNRLTNGVLKITVCAYRPWIRDSRIIPYGNSITTATGYSFPSGHTMNAATVFGGVTVRKDVPQIIRVVLFVFVVLVGLSRNYLGVHTPQDVLIGIVVGMLVMWLVAKMMEWVDAHPEKDILVFCIGIGLAAALAAYAALKSYPTDYDAEGKLLVDGAKMANDTFKGVGYCTGFLTGWILERRFVGFTTDVPLSKRITRFVVGMLAYYAISLYFVLVVKTWIPGAAGSLISCFVQMFYVTFVHPWFIKRFEKPAAQPVPV